MDCRVFWKGWWFEIKQVRGIKTDAFGGEYSGSVTISIVDGEPHVENLIFKEDTPFVKSDRLAIASFIRSLGFKRYLYSRYKHGKRIQAVRYV